MWKDVEELEDLQRISDNYENSESLWGVDYWSVWEDYYQEEKYERN